MNSSNGLPKHTISELSYSSVLKVVCIKPFIWKWFWFVQKLTCTCRWRTFSYEWSHTRTHFYMKVKGNSLWPKTFSSLEFPVCLLQWGFSSCQGLTWVWQATLERRMGPNYKTAIQNRNSKWLFHRRDIFWAKWNID